MIKPDPKVLLDVLVVGAERSEEHPGQLILVAEFISLQKSADFRFYRV